MKPAIDPFRSLEVKLIVTRAPAAVSLAVTLMMGLMTALIVTSPLSGAPLDPAAVARWAAEGNLDQLAAIERTARAKGVNEPGQWTGFHLLAGEGRSRTATRGAIVLLAEFSDNPADTASHPPAHYQDLLFSSGTYPTGSMRDFFAENSYGNFEVTGSAAGWFLLPETYAYYTNGEYGWGEYPQNAQRMVEDAVLAADPYVDFSLYDNDGPDGVPHSGDDDGYVDGLFVVHAGPEGGGGDGWAIWSHAWNTSYPVPVDGVYVWAYSMEPENATIGVFCHEFGHVLGLPDLYDFTYVSNGLGYWSLMSGGGLLNAGRTPGHLDAWCKWQLGFLEPITPATLLPNEVILPVEEYPVAYYLWSDGAPSDEYFLAEFRRRWGFDFYLAYDGLLIYHVDEAVPDNTHPRCGAGSPHYKVALEQADGECDLENRVNQMDLGDPYPGLGGAMNPNYTFSIFSTPSSRAYSGQPTEVALTNISLEGDHVTADIRVSDMTGVELLEENAGAEGAVSPGLLQASPNPFNPAVTITYQVPGARGHTSAATLAIYDLQGRRVRLLLERDVSCGRHSSLWDGCDDAGGELPSGVYLARFFVEGSPHFAKLVLMR